MARDGSGNGNKINRSNFTQKKTNLHSRTFLYISLRLFCTTTMPFCTTKTWNRLVTHYFLWRNCCMCSPKIFLLVFLFAFTVLAANISYFLTATMKFSCFSSQRNSSPLFLITRSSSFSVIHESVDIKNNVEKDLTFLLSFYLKFQVVMWFPAKNTSSCLWCHTEIFYIGMPVSVVRTDGRSVGRSGARSRDYQNYSDRCITTS